MTCVTSSACRQPESGVVLSAAEMQNIVAKKDCGVNFLRFSIFFLCPRSVCRSDISCSGILCTRKPQCVPHLCLP